MAKRSFELKWSDFKRVTLNEFQTVMKSAIKSQSTYGNPVGFLEQEIFIGVLPVPRSASQSWIFWVVSCPSPDQSQPV